MHPAEQYARDAARGRITCCKWVRLAAKRHLEDHKSGAKRGLWFDAEDAQRILDFSGLLRHSKGEWAGQVITLEPWQQFILWCVFGWKRDWSDRWIRKLRTGGIEDTRGLRRFRTMFVECGRKNGKSTLASIISLYMLTADRESGAECYVVSTKKDQSLICFNECERMVAQSPALKKRVKNYKNNLHIPGTASKLQPLGADSDTMDGLNAHLVVADELHAWRSRAVWDKMRTSMGARRQPLMAAITTAGNNRASFCFELHNYCASVLSGKANLKDSDTFFGIIYSLDDNDDWRNERVWVKANPNLGVSKKWSDMQDEAATAKAIPSALNAFKQLHLNIWVQSAVSWLPVDHWQACAGDIDAIDFDDLLAGRACYAGLDLASVSDLAAFVMVFPSLGETDRYWVLCRFWCPEETVESRSIAEGVKYDTWVQDGYIEATPGNVIDYKYILAQIAEDAQRFKLREIAYDRFGASNIAQTMQDDMGLTVVQMGQGFLSMSPPMKELERLVKGHQIYHGDNQVLNWMADNVVAALDPAGNIKPDKKRSKEKIDGITALIMAVARAVTNTTPPPKDSIYETRGIITL